LRSSWFFIVVSILGVCGANPLKWGAWPRMMSRKVGTVNVRAGEPSSPSERLLFVASSLQRAGVVPIVQVMKPAGPPRPRSPARASVREKSPFLVRPPKPPRLVDGEERGVKYLRLSVTDRCQYRCQYCLPADGVTFVPRAELLDFDEIETMVRVFVGMGIDRVRLTGGEPTLRRDLVSLVRRLARIDGLVDLAMTTNGDRMPELAKPLRDAGLRRVNISLDTLRADRFAELTRVGNLERVRAGVAATVDAGFDAVKLNTVVIRGVNDDEFGDLVRYASEQGVTQRFIEYMPIGLDGFWSAETFMPVDEMVRELEHEFEVSAPLGYGPEANIPGQGPARYRELTPHAGGPSTRVGFITAVSHDFCGTCNRVRLTATGTLQPCLAVPGHVSLRDMLRAGADVSVIQAAVRESLWGKPLGHEFEAEGGGGRVFQTMSMTGG
jgi:GTP 3',8-cyclase